VVDVHDALRADRPYRKATPLAAVAAHLKREAGRFFDAEMVTCWLNVLNNPT
jgi:HD-GYP domain-containing protein (c-di-GMP phosphodiesterase class II)